MKTVCPFLLQKCKITFCDIVCHRKRQHISGTVNITLFFVDLVDGLIIGQQKAYFCLIRTAKIIHRKCKYLFRHFPGIKRQLFFVLALKIQCHDFLLVVPVEVFVLLFTVLSVFFCTAFFSYSS